ncbi:acyl-CoA thioester hydrolase [Salirhabdus euzebyi]|uniref:Acyl-CoA thioester hydrolase n=1 Tax=Salirhabdus euzebyi TaxID=394506 RepID=A0A841PTA3_9BACI|nr:thioesterase family protein [Salirhabdus euzebyi]MBB6452030.1 acyl-CoA thioester hydrolase [Salirhabdus euzebyi]
MKSINYIEDFQIWMKNFEFYIPIKIRFSETDMFGHVNNVSPFIYFEEARIAFMAKVGIFQDLSEKSEKVPVVADQQCDYHKQIYFGDTLKLYVKANHVGNTSIDLHYLAINQREEVCITGRGRIVQINPHTGKPVQFAEKQLEKINQYKG